MPLYEVAILKTPTKKEEEEGGCESLVFGPKAVVATNPQSAGVVAIRDESFPKEIDPSRLQVLVRPFV